MNITLKKYQVVLLVFLLTTNPACADTTCVFDKDYFKESRYTSNNDVAEFIWNNTTKEGKGITKNGDLFSVKHWSCNHYGTHAVMLSGPYITDKIGKIENKFIQLANIALDKNEFEMVDKHLGNISINLSFESKIIRIETPEYSEFYLIYSIVNESLVLEIKLYKG